jgi:hypothetical protein
MTFLSHAALAAISLLVLPLSAAASNLVVSHPPTEAPTYLDFEPKGVDSPGDTRIFHFDGKTGDGQKVVTDWIMTTTGEGATEGANSRVTEGVFSFGDNHDDQIIIRGAGLYANASNTFKPSTQLSRAIIGGTGKYAGASGMVVSKHLEDGSWLHEFDFTD